MSEEHYSKAYFYKRISQIILFTVPRIISAHLTEKAKKFYTDRKLPFSLLYDNEAVAHKKFGFTGVPGLVILDKKGNIRLKHEGYNTAEDIQATLLPVIHDLLAE